MDDEASGENLALTMSVSFIAKATGFEIVHVSPMPEKGACTWIASARKPTGETVLLVCQGTMYILVEDEDKEAFLTWFSFLVQTSPDIYEFRPDV